MFTRSNSFIRRGRKLPLKDSLENYLIKKERKATFNNSEQRTKLIDHRRGTHKKKHVSVPDEVI